MKNYYKSLVLFFLLMLSNAYGDSPLTSTDFSMLYDHEKIIKNVDANSILDDEHLEYLNDPSNPIAIKMALVNKYGWQFDDKRDNVSKYFKSVQKKHKYSDENDLLEYGKDYELLTMGYLIAITNYLDKEKLLFALKFATKARDMNPNSYTYNIIPALINSQLLMHSGDWCGVYTSVDIVDEIPLVWDEMSDIPISPYDMDVNAIDYIYSYIYSYKEYCKK